MSKDSSGASQSDKTAFIAVAVIVILVVVSAVAEDYIKKYQYELAVIFAVVFVTALVYMLLTLPARINKLSETSTLIFKKIDNNKKKLKEIGRALDTVQHDISEGDSRVMSWNKFWSYTVRLLHLIEMDHDFQPELVLSIGRSGAIVGSLIAGNLNATPFISLDRISNFDGPNGQRQIEIIPDLNNLKTELSDKKILIVMSECDSGKTLLEVMGVLSKLEGIDMTKIKTAVLFRGMKSEFQPDYFVIRDTIDSRQDFPFRTGEWPRTSVMPTN